MKFTTLAKGISCLHNYEIHFVFIRILGSEEEYFRKNGQILNIFALPLKPLWDKSHGITIYFPLTPKSALYQI